MNILEKQKRTLLNSVACIKEGEWTLFVSTYCEYENFYWSALLIWSLMWVRWKTGWAYVQNKQIRLPLTLVYEYGSSMEAKARIAEMVQKYNSKKRTLNKV